MGLDKIDKIKSLHSRYNPEAEAERYINSLPLNEKLRFLIMIEPGLGYMAAPLKKKLPKAKIIALHVERLHPETPGNNFQCIDAEWNPEKGIPIQDFLEKEIPDIEASEIRLLEWRPALTVYGKAYLSLVEETASFIKRLDAGYRTTKAFGRRWLRNFFKNLNFIKTVLVPSPQLLPLLVTGAGPSLEEVIPKLKEPSIRNSLFILASSSSTAALAAEGLIPDMIISTDGSPWALFHLFQIFRANPYKSHLAASLCAALPSQCEKLPVLPIIDGSLWQAVLMKELEIPCTALPQRGTVTATALDLAFTLSKNEVYIAGMDLQNRDILSHSRPYSLDSFIDEKASRLYPAYSQTFNRSSLLKNGGSFSIYASWFQKQLSSYPNRLFSLGKNNPVFGTTGKDTWPSIQAFKGPKTTESFKTVTLTQEKNRSGRAFEYLLKILDGKEAFSPLVFKELSSLLLPGKDNVSKEELINTITLVVQRGGRVE